MAALERGAVSNRLPRLAHELWLERDSPAILRLFAIISSPLRVHQLHIIRKSACSHRDKGSGPTMSQPDSSIGSLEQNAEQLASQIPTASSRDEALETAIKAAEAAMQALRIAEPDDKARLSAQVKFLLATAEDVKSGRDWKTIGNHTPDHISYGSHTNGESTKQAQRVLVEPSSTRLPSKAEQILLLRSSFLHGFKFPPWAKAPEASEFERKDGEDLFLYVSFVLVY